MSSSAEITNRHIFEDVPVPRAIAALALPTVVSQLISTVYNLADTFWVGRLGDPIQLAALSLIFPTQMLLTALGNLFGIGAGTVISRRLGSRDLRGASDASVFSIYCGVSAAVLFSLVFLLFRPQCLDILGVTPAVTDYVNTYLNIAVLFGSVPSIFNMLIANMIRGEGMSRQASIGLSLGGILNIILDPFFVLPFGFGMEIRGAALATLISTLVSSAYFIVLLLRRRGKTVISFMPRFFKAARSSGRSVVLAGVPAFFQVLMAALSNLALNSLMISYGEIAEAAIGVTKKIDSIPMGMLSGLSQGAVPLIAYNYGSGDRDRMRRSLRVTLVCCLTVSLIAVAIVEIFARRLTGFFISDTQTIAYGAVFLRLHCASAPFMAVTFSMLSFFQATNENRQSFALSLIRKGVVDIPLMFLLNMVIPIYGIIACQPITDTVSAACAITMFVFWRRRQSPSVSVSNKE